MAGSVNKVILIGNVGKAPDVRRLPSGDPVVSFSLATTESWNDRNSGERRDKTDWHNIVIFSKGLAKVAEQYVEKGSKLYIEGSLQTRKWQDKEGSERYTTEVVLQGFNSQLILLSRGNNDGIKNKSDEGYAQQPKSAPKDNYSQEIDDEIPF